MNEAEIRADHVDRFLKSAGQASNRRATIRIACQSCALVTPSMRNAIMQVSSRPRRDSSASTACDSDLRTELPRKHPQLSSRRLPEAVAICTISWVMTQSRTALRSSEAGLPANGRTANRQLADCEIGNWTIS